MFFIKKINSIVRYFILLNYILLLPLVSLSHDQNITFSRIFINEKKVKVDFITHLNLITDVFPEVLDFSDSLISDKFSNYFKKEFNIKNNNQKCFPKLISFTPIPEINSYKFSFEYDCKSPIDLFSIDYNLFFYVSEIHQNIVDILLSEQTQQITFSSSYKHLDFSVSELLISWGKEPFLRKKNTTKLKKLDTEKLVSVIDSQKVIQSIIKIHDSLLSDSNTFSRIKKKPEKSFTNNGLNEKQSNYSRIFFFLKLGIEHILTGYDHILFLLGLLLISTRFGNIIKIVTSFTIAHSITLVLATLHIIHLSSKVTESVIALSIIYISLENIFIIQKKSVNPFIFASASLRWLTTFVFGLIHGLGFSSILLNLQLPEKDLLSSLLFFNLGVEIGQLSIVLILFPLIVYTHKKHWNDKVVILISLCIGLAGFLWLIDRLFIS